jgi:hypothetical protein
MEGERTHTVALMAAVIYASRTAGAGFKPSDKLYAAIAEEAWALHQAIVGGDEIRGPRAGFREP